jgi:hypothetical protein
MGALILSGAQCRRRWLAEGVTRSTLSDMTRRQVLHPASGRRPGFAHQTHYDRRQEETT